VDHNPRVNARWLFPGIALVAIAAGGALFTATRAPATSPNSDVSPTAIYAAEFRDEQGGTQSLARFPNKLLVVNFWATWCAPCREEMPAFTRVQSRWAGRGVQFVGIAQDDAEKVMQFGRELRINYPLWTGGDEVGELSRRLGNRLGVLPYTVILDPQGTVLERRVGPYTEAALDASLTAFTTKSR
jgi:thiol-disulfide isomerase/thioredoxin